MQHTPVKELHKCSVVGCLLRSSVIIEKKMGEDTLRFAYCEFHHIISSGFFASDKRREIHI